MAKKPKAQPQHKDLEAFKQAVQGIKPLMQGKVRLTPPKQKPARKPAAIEDEPSFFDGGAPRDFVQADDLIEYKCDGVSQKILRKLGKGQYNVEAVLDLHRKTIEEARIEVNRFLHECTAQEIKI